MESSGDQRRKRGFDALSKHNFPAAVDSSSSLLSSVGGWYAKISPPFPIHFPRKKRGEGKEGASKKKRGELSKAFLEVISGRSLMKKKKKQEKNPNTRRRRKKGFCGFLVRFSSFFAGFLL